MSDLRTVGTYATAAEAHLKRVLLEMEGITVVVEDENQPGGDGPAWPADGVKVRVREQDLADAVRVLRIPGGDRAE